MKAFSPGQQGESRITSLHARLELNPSYEELVAQAGKLKSK